MSADEQVRTYTYQRLVKIACETVAEFIVAVTTAFDGIHKLSVRTGHIVALVVVVIQWGYTTGALILPWPETVEAQRVASKAQFQQGVKIVPIVARAAVGAIDAIRASFWACCASINREIRV